MSYETREMIVVSRYWNHPEIHASISPEGIGLGMSVDLFLDALAWELEHPSSIVTRKQLRKALQEATNKVIENMKESSAFVVSQPLQK